MANVCDNCGESCYRTTFIGGRFLGVDCHCAPMERRRKSAINPFSDLTLDHVHGDDGKPLRVTSMRQLSAAETKHNFASVVLNQDHGNINDPPQQRPMSVGDVYRRKFANRG